MFAKRGGWIRPAMLGGLLLMAAAVALPPALVAARTGVTLAVVGYGRGLLAVSGLALALVAALASLPAARPGPSPALMQSVWWPRLLVLAIGLYVLVYGVFTFDRHARYNSATLDLGVQDQVVWNTAHGRWYASSIEVPNYLGDHFKPLVALLVPLYWVQPSVTWLLGFQTLVLALAAAPIYRLAARRLGGGLYGLLFAGVYLLYPPAGYINRFDFHWEATVVLWFLAAVDAADRRRWGWMSVWLALALLSKEEMGLTVAAFGLWLAACGRRRLGLAWAVGGVSFALAVTLWLIPAIRQGPSDTLARYGWLGPDPAAMLVTLLTRPQVVLPHLLGVDALRYLVSLAGPLAFLPLGGSLTLPTLPALLYNLLSGEMTQRVAYYHYVAAIVPFMLAGAIAAAGRLMDRARARQAGWMGWALCTVLPLFVLWHLLGVNNPLADDGAVQPAWQRQPNAANVAAALALIPPDAPVLTTNYYGPHLTQREQVTILFDPGPAEGLSRAEYAFFNTLDTRGRLPWSCADYAAQLAAAADLGYGLVYAQAGAVLVQRDGGDPVGLRQLAAELCTTSPASTSSNIGEP